ncbi:MAG: phytoene desaturase family protein [Planctomycetes bacterium]|jgi:phytoene desaturase|nr:phytoene desaturase family protein [Planctomycetota bacterium]
MEKTVNNKKIIIVGAGPGGLTAGMLLAHRGFDVQIFEKENKVGGRNSAIELDGFSFDIGPTFLIFKSILDEVFAETGRKSSDYLEFTKLDPMYRLFFEDLSFDISDDQNKMQETIKKHFPGNEQGYERFRKKEKNRYEKMFPCLQKPYLNILSLANKDLLKAYPYLSLGRSMYDQLKDYYSEEKLRIAFTFQSKYIGMSPWNCPAAFMIMPYFEHAFGVYHVSGGLNKISAAMAKVVREEKGQIHLSSPVKRIILEKNKAVGVELDAGGKEYADEIIVNADFAYAMANLVEPGALKKWSKEKLMKKKFSCSTFMLYLGLDKTYDLPHHNIVFSTDYRTYISDIAEHKDPSEDISFYVRNASPVDKTVAPAGKSNLYVLVPVSNKKSCYDWPKNKKAFRDNVINKLRERLGMADIEEHIVAEKMITPDEWVSDYNVFLGATFNLGHNLFQMLYFRPHNRFEELKNCYLVGGGTHPGSGLPTIYESARITTNLISKKYAANL